jgi:hypothetical protein
MLRYILGEICDRSIIEIQDACMHALRGFEIGAKLTLGAAHPLAAMFRSRYI